MLIFSIAMVLVAMGMSFAMIGVMLWDVLELSVNGIIQGTLQLMERFLLMLPVLMAVIYILVLA